MLSDLLVELQEIDTAADRLEHRRSTLPERAALDDALGAQRAWQAEETRLASRLDELSSVIEQAEADSAEIDQARARLAAQLRTVIAPREAEAIQREMATLDERRSELDDRGLSALEEQASLDDELTAHRARRDAVTDAVDVAEAAFRSVIAELDTDADALSARRGPVHERLDPAVRVRYDRLRSQLGVAVARLVGRRCDGCNLDLSPAEIDQIKDVADDELAACPQCDRILVR